MNEHPTVKKMWKEFLKSIGDNHHITNRSYQAWHFCDNKEDANELAELVLQGKKRATASAVWCYKAEGESLPSPGNYSIITDFSGSAKCVIETTLINVVPFNKVSAEFAAKEGEGDLSLEYWRKGHRDFFTRDMAEIGREFSEDMPVVCEEFKVVYPIK